MNKKNRRVKVTYGRTFNTGNYESKKFGLSVETDIDDTAVLDDVFKELYTELQRNLGELVTR